MAAEQTESKYRKEQPGDWGTPAAAQGGEYGTDELRLPDGTKLFFRFWRASDAVAPVVVLLHGLGAHSGWFIDMGNELAARGSTIYMPDHRGFGRSEGPRGHVRDWRVYPQDTAAFMDEVRRRAPDAPLFVLGHSMGGRFALHVAAADAGSGRNLLAGLILVNPWVKEVSKIPVHQQIGIGVGGMRGSGKIVNYDYPVPDMTANSEAHQLLRDDPNWVKQQSASFLYQVGLRMASGLLKQAKAVRCPALVLQSDADKVLVIKMTRKLYEVLGSRDKTYKTYPAFAHDFEFEPGRAVLDEDIVAWCANHTSS
jgi:alpha-beta hydrolase superfamily lysophospholipase